eukprot:2123436-Amphidinium_carterae.1
MHALQCTASIACMQAAGHDSGTADFGCGVHETGCIDVEKGETVCALISALECEARHLLVLEACTPSSVGTVLVIGSLQRKSKVVHNDRGSKGPFSSANKPMWDNTGAQKLLRLFK